jgi:hypothetical protein
MTRYLLLFDSYGTDRTENTSSIISCSLVAGETTCPQLFPSNGCCTVSCLHRRYLATGQHLTASLLSFRGWSLSVTDDEVETWSLSKLYFNFQFLPRRKHRTSVTKKINRWILIKEIIIVYPENHSKYSHYVGKVHSFLVLKQVVHIVTTLLQRVKCLLCLLNSFVLCVICFDARM